MPAAPRDRASGIPYFLQISFGDATLNVRADQIDSLLINLDIHELLPSFRLKMPDTASFLSTAFPMGTRMKACTIQLGRGSLIEDTTRFDFDVYRRFPSSDNVFDIEGLLESGNLFAPDLIRSFSGSISASLGDLATDKTYGIGVDGVEISPSLLYDKTLIQPGWNNATFLDYLKRNLIGKIDESGFYCFIKCVGQKKIFVFKALNDFNTTPYKYAFINSTNHVVAETATGQGKKKELLNPIMEYKVFDNVKLLTAYGGGTQNYTYFDYENSSFSSGSVGLADLPPSLSDRYLISDDAQDVKNIAVDDTGRGNAFTLDFKSRALNLFSKKIYNLSRIKIMTLGLEDIYPGDKVKLLFFFGERVNIDSSNQFQGFWLVERVTHICSTNFFTELTLKRCGIDETVIFQEFKEYGLAKAADFGAVVTS